MSLNTDIAWELWGERDPYYGVLTNPKFRAAVMTAKEKDEFFILGRSHVNDVMDMCRLHLDPAFCPQKILDFGCGVGRLLIPFAEIAENVVGMDISSSMLAEARRNCDERGVPNVLLVASDDELSMAPGTFDLVHSCLVLQHIEIARGLKLFKTMIQKVQPGGCGAIQITFGSALHANGFGSAPVPLLERPQTPLSHAKAKVKKILEPFGLQPQSSAVVPEVEMPDPEMQMNYYNMSEIMFIMQRSGIRKVFSVLENYGGPMGAFLYFQRPSLGV